MAEETSAPVDVGSPAKWRRFMKRRTFWLMLVVAYAGVMLFGGCADKLILFPSQYAINAGSARRQTVALPDGKVVEAWVARSMDAKESEARAYVIEFTGNATRAEQIADYVAHRWGDRPVEVWAVNYPGYGGSSGPARLRDIAPAALAVYDEVAKRPGGKTIFLAGNSLGTTAALYVASRRPCAGLVLQNPPAIRNLMLTQYGWWNLWLVAGPLALKVPKELDGPTSAALVKAPAVFVLAEQDDFVVPANQRKVVDAFAGPKRVISMKGGHNDGVGGDAEVELQKGIDWLCEQAGLKKVQK
jgi:hypothetical protein